MKLSIITINLNNRDGLQKTIDSVVSQTFKDFEWIVIDGGSTDGSKELIEQYADHFSYWVSEPDKGIYNAMNKGIKVACGEYLLFLNSGDWLYNSDVLKRTFSSSPKSDIIYGDVALCKNGIIDEIRHYSDKLSFKYLLKLSVAHCSTFIRRNLLNESPYNEMYKIVADRYFFLTHALKNKSFEHLNIIVSCFDLSGISSTEKERCRAEEERLTKEVIPESILVDIEDLEKYESINLDNKDIKVIALRHKFYFFRKLTNAFIKLNKHLRV